MNLNTWMRFLIINLEDHTSEWLYFLMQVLFGILLIFHVPTLDPFLGYTIIEAEAFDIHGYEELSGGEHICPERHVNIFSSK